MRAHIAEGNRAEALRVYERCRRLLAQELGAFPSPETESIYRSLLEGTPTVVEAERTPEALPSEQEPVAQLESPTSLPPVQRRPTRGPRSMHVVLVAAVLAVVAAVAAAFALESRGSPPPDVVPNSVVRIDPHTLKVTQVVNVGGAPDLIIAAGGFVWVTHYVLRGVGPAGLRNGGDRTLTRVDPSTGNAVDVGGGLAPCGLTADPSGDVWVVNCFPLRTGSHDNVVLVNAKTLQFEETWRIPDSGDLGYYRGSVFGGGSLWVTEPDILQIVTQIDPRVGATRTIHIAQHAGALAWSAAYGDLWLTNFDAGSLMRLRPATGVVQTIDNVAALPDFPVVDGDVVWAGDWAAPAVERLHAIGTPRERTISLPAKRPDAGVWSVSAGAGSLWATTPRDGALWRIDPATNHVTRIPIPYAPIGVTADANDVWVTVRNDVWVNGQ